MSELAGAAELFFGIGIMVVMFVFAYLLYQLVRIIKPVADKEEKYELYEEMALDKHAKKNGIDLSKEVLKRNAYKKKSFRKKVEEEVFKELFGKDEDEKPSKESK